MTKQRSLYLIKCGEMPIGILDNQERADAVHGTSLGIYSYRVISEGEANLLRPNIADYHASQRQE